jgi:hypothetical protein
MSDSRKKKKSGKNFKKKRSRQEVQEKKNQIRKTRKRNQTRISRTKRIRQEFKNARILPGEAFFASPAKILSTRISPEDPDLFFQARILYRRNGKRILTDNQEKQESGKK